MTLTAPTLPFVHPSDERLARELIDECIALADEEARAREFIEQLNQEHGQEFEI